MKILLVDDEASIRKLIGGLVVDAGYEFVFAEDGRAAVLAAQRERPDLIIMDVMLPVMDGFAATRELRKRGVSVPIVFLSAKGDIVDKGVGFDAGGDDYMTKPFDPRELMMHIEAHLRRAGIAAGVGAAVDRERVIELGRFVVDVGQFRVTKDGAHVPLTPKEFRIFLALASNPGIVLSREQLVGAAWEKGFSGEVTSIPVFIKKLREKIEDDPAEPRVISTVWGVGYRLDPAACEPAR